MGNFYANITLLGPDQDQVAEYLEQQGLRAYVSPTVSRVTVIGEVNCDTQTADVLENLSTKLSAQFDCPALAVLNHDSDILLYWLYLGGMLSDEYDSTPGYFEGAQSPLPKGGNARLLCSTFGARPSTDQVERILRSRSGKGYVDEVDRHLDLVNALGLPAFVINFSYRDLDSGELPEGLVANTLKHTGAENLIRLYANIVVHGPNQDQITNYLNQQGRIAYISPTIQDITVVYEKQSELGRMPVLGRLAALLSGELGCTTLAVLYHRDNIFGYKLYVGGMLFDEYESLPTYIGIGGNAQTLCHAFGVEQNVAKVEQILRAPGKSEHFQLTADLANALGLPTFYVGLGYSQLNGGEISESLDRTGLRHTGEH